jgi:hypothetical protein
VTLADVAADIAELASTESYRLVILPAEARPDREFAALLRAAHETMGVVRGSDGTVAPLPSRANALDVGDAVYALARPDALRRLKADAEPPASTPESA